MGIEDYDCVVCVMSEERYRGLDWIDGNQIVCYFVSIVTLMILQCV